MKIDMESRRKMVEAPTICALIEYQRVFRNPKELLSTSADSEPSQLVITQQDNQRNRQSRVSDGGYSQAPQTLQARLHHEMVRVTRQKL